MPPPLSTELRSGSRARDPRESHADYFPPSCAFLVISRSLKREHCRPPRPPARPRARPPRALQPARPPERQNDRTIDRPNASPPARPPVCPSARPNELRPRSSTKPRHVVPKAQGMGAAHRVAALQCSAGVCVVLHIAAPPCAVLGSFGGPRSAIGRSTEKFQGALGFVPLAPRLAAQAGRLPAMAVFWAIAARAPEEAAATVRSRLAFCMRCSRAFLARQASGLKPSVHTYGSLIKAPRLPRRRRVASSCVAIWAL